MGSAEKLAVLFKYTTLAFEEIIKEVTDIEIKKGDSFILSSPSLVSATVGVSGINGRIILTATYEDAANVATYMNFGTPVQSQDEVFMYFAEFANMYCGRTVTYVNDKFGTREISIVPPAIFTADDLKTISLNFVTQKAYYDTEFGKFMIDIGSIDDEDDFGF